MAELARHLHIRFEGRSHDLILAELGLMPTSADEDIRLAVARFLEVGIGRLESYVIERHPTGNITLRPEAVFG